MGVLWLRRQTFQTLTSCSRLIQGPRLGTSPWIAKWQVTSVTAGLHWETVGNGVTILGHIYMHLLTAQGLVRGGGCRIVFHQPFLMFILPTFECRDSGGYHWVRSRDLSNQRTSVLCAFLGCPLVEDSGSWWGQGPRIMTGFGFTSSLPSSQVQRKHFHFNCNTVNSVRDVGFFLHVILILSQQDLISWELSQKQIFKSIS